MRHQNALLPQDIGEGLIKNYEQVVKGLVVKEIDLENKKVLLSEAVLPVEYAKEGSEYKMQLKGKITQPKFEVFDTLYNEISSCVAPNQRLSDECESLVSNKLPGVKIEKEDNLMRVEYGTIKFAFDPSVNLPPRAVFTVS